MIKLSEVDTREDMLSCTRHYTLSIEEAQRALVEHLILNNVEGDIVELGCGTGKNTHIFADTLKKYNRSNMVYGFDTFAGYTESDMSETKDRFHPGLMEGLLDNQNSKRWNVDENIIKNKMINSGFEGVTEITKGDVKETTKNFVPKSGKISMLYVDCNIYGASKSGIDNLKQFFSDGCLVVTDSGFCPPPPDICGEQEALLEYHQESKNRMYRTHFGDYIAFLVEVKK